MTFDDVEVARRAAHGRRRGAPRRSGPAGSSPVARSATPVTQPPSGPSSRRSSADRPDDVVFSEEAVDDPRRLRADRVWIVDPLDGTREYGEPGRHDWAVHVALWEGGDLDRGRRRAARRWTRSC